MIGHDLRPLSRVDQTDNVTDVPAVRRDATTARRGPHAALADAVEANIRGQAEADRTLKLVAKDVAHPDALHVAALEIWRTCGTAGLLGFHRRLQKVLERRPA